MIYIFPARQYSSNPSFPPPGFGNPGGNKKKKKKKTHLSVSPHLSSQKRPNLAILPDTDARLSEILPDLILDLGTLEEQGRFAVHADDQIGRKDGVEGDIGAAQVEDVCDRGEVGHEHGGKAVGT